MRILITGSEGFIAKNLAVRLSELPGFDVTGLGRGAPIIDLLGAGHSFDAVVHLAGTNRPTDPTQFAIGNGELTQAVCDALIRSERPIPIIYSSSIQADSDNPYGRSKLAGERALSDYAKRTGKATFIYRLPNVFGKWCRPNYNSVVATFCHNIANDLPISINDPASQLRLVYIDDVVSDIINALGQVGDQPVGTLLFRQVTPEYVTTVGGLAEQLTKFKVTRTSYITEPVGAGLTRALYSSFISYLPPQDFSYALVKHADPRGEFVEMLKTKDSGQFSYFTAFPGITRGGHYHHSKTEKFLVIRGRALFKFRHIVTNDTYSITTDSGTPVVVDTVPGWTHDITNIGDTEMIVMLWANEIFDREKPDTISSPL